MSSSVINCLVFIDPTILDNFLKNHASDHKKLLSKRKQTSNNYFYFRLEQQYLSLIVHVQDQEATYPGKQLDATYYFDSTIDIYFYGFHNPEARYDYYFSSTPDDISCVYPLGDNDVTILRGVKKGSLFSNSFYQENQQELKKDYLTFTKKKEKTNYVPPYTFSKRKTHQFIILESIIQTILIKRIQENPPKDTIKVAIVSHPHQLRCFVEKYVDVNKDIKNSLETDFFDYFRRLFGIKLVIKKTHTRMTLFSGHPSQDVSTMEYKILTKYTKGWDWSILGCDLEIFIFNQGESYDEKRTYNLVFDTKLIDGQIDKLKELKQKKYHQEKNDIKTYFKNTEPALILKEYLNNQKDTSSGEQNISKEASSVLQIFNFDNNDFDYYFTSSLLRSRETFRAFFPDHEKVIILPCAQEISYYVDECYDKNQKTIFKAPENIVNVLRSNLPTKLKMDWSFYDNSSCPKGSNLIEEMIKIIFYKKIEEKKYELLQNYFDILSHVFTTDLEESQITINFLNYFDKNPNKFENKDATEYVQIYLNNKIVNGASFFNFETDPYFKTEVELYKYLSYLQKLVLIYYTNNDIGNFYTFIEVAKRFDIFKNSLSSISLDNLKIMFEKIKELDIPFCVVYLQNTILTEIERDFLRETGKKQLEEAQKGFNVRENLEEKINVNILHEAIEYLNLNYDAIINDNAKTILEKLEAHLNNKFLYKRDIKIIEKFILFMADFVNTNTILFKDGKPPSLEDLFSDPFESSINGFQTSGVNLFTNNSLDTSEDIDDQFRLYAVSFRHYLEDILQPKDFDLRQMLLYHHVIVSTGMNSNTLNIILGRKILNYMPERLENDTSVQPFSPEFLFMNPMECCTELLREYGKKLEESQPPPPEINPEIEEQFKKFFMTKHDENKKKFHAWSIKSNHTASNSVFYTNSRVSRENLETDINFDLLNHIFTEFKEEEITQRNYKQKILDYAKTDKKTCFFLIQTAHYMNDNTILSDDSVVLNEYTWFYVYFIQNFINNYRAYHLQNTADEYFQLITEFLNGFLNGSSDYLQIFNMSELLRRTNANKNVINVLLQRYIIGFPKITQQDNSENYFTKRQQQKRQQQKRRRQENENSINPNDPNY
jgi:hypothetical protein